MTPGLTEVSAPAPTLSSQQRRIRHLPVARASETRGAWTLLGLYLVLLLIGYHIGCYRLMRELAAGQSRRSQRWYKIFNEAPALLLIAIVILATVKPF